MPYINGKYVPFTPAPAGLKEALEAEDAAKPPLSTIAVDTSDYVRSHGREPRGRGTWGFYIGNTSGDASLYWAKTAACITSMTYSEARRLAKLEAARRHCEYISVAT